MESLIALEARIAADGTCDPRVMEGLLCAAAIGFTVMIGDTHVPLDEVVQTDEHVLSAFKRARNCVERERGKIEEANADCTAGLRYPHAQDIAGAAETRRSRLDADQPLQ